MGLFKKKQQQSWDDVVAPDDPNAMINLGWLAQEVGDLVAARSWYEQAAKLGNPDAMFRLGVLAKKAGDLDAARAWYEQSAKLGNENAASNLAKMDASSKGAVIFC